MKRLPIFLVFLFGCGGDGSSGATSDFSGTWKGNLELVSDQCFIRMNPLEEEHRVTVDGRSVSLATEDGRLLTGNATGDDEFEVEFSEGPPSPTIDRISYSSVRDGTALVEVSLIFSRPGGCVTTWSGLMTR